MDKKTIIIVVVIAVAVIVGGYMLGSGLSDFRPAADQVRTDIQSAGQRAAGASDELLRAAEAQRQLEATSIQLREIQRKLEELNRKDAERAKRNKTFLDEGREILRGVRQNGAITDQKP